RAASISVSWARRASWSSGRSTTGPSSLSVLPKIRLNNPIAHLLRRPVQTTCPVPGGQAAACPVGAHHLVEHEVTGRLGVEVRYRPVDGALGGVDVHTRQSEATLQRSLAESCR